MHGQAEQRVTAFNECINAHDVPGLSRMMTDDHVFTDASNHTVSGKAACLQTWTVFFAGFPDYRNIFDEIHSDGDTVVMAGHSVCSDPRLAGPAIWTATIRADLVSQWHVLEDTPQNRARFGLSR